MLFPQLLKLTSTQQLLLINGAKPFLGVYQFLIRFIDHGQHMTIR